MNYKIDSWDALLGVYLLEEARLFQQKRIPIPPSSLALQLPEWTKPLIMGNREILRARGVSEIDWVIGNTCVLTYVDVILDGEVTPAVLCMLENVIP